LMTHDKLAHSKWIVIYARAHSRNMSFLLMKHFPDL
jgi:hypothetical protein